ncbi:heterokaryon incompatibility protein-domain-containing protein [Xylariomycetidae sp. FL2044]|nr:heterokaryon incompatibility protein-domain-containing protein [Xylariomycetidae sp. FL2044]
MASQSLDLYHYTVLPMSIRVAELCPGKIGDPIICRLHEVEWSNLCEYEALSYAWGDPNDKAPITVHGKTLNITKSLYVALNHLRYGDKSRFLWADAICINQSDISERGAQVRQMRRVFEQAKTVLIWLGPDTEAKQASIALSSARRITEFLCQKIGISLEDLVAENEVYTKIIFENRDKIPLPHECDFITDGMWGSLLWLYKHPYFTRVWVIQEINANRHRIVQCGYETTIWEAVELVAGYIILESAFSKSHGFSDAYCWWTSTISSEFGDAENWLHILYLASNFRATDPRDVVYGLRGMMKCNDGGWLLEPDYNKTTVDVYRDSVEAALINFKNVNALMYVHGVEHPSWVPRWNEPMLFRNPFRFGRPLPWRPAGDSLPKWSIDRQQNLLSLHGLNLDKIERAETYYETLFSNAMLASEEGKADLKTTWLQILAMMEASLPSLPLENDTLRAMATSFSFGLDHKCNPADEKLLFHNFVAYLEMVLDEKAYAKYVSPETAEECKDGTASLFGKPVWDFEYPPASVFVTENKMIGCCIAPTEPGDLIVVPNGNDGYRIRGFCFIDGIMKGEKQKDVESVFDII